MKLKNEALRELYETIVNGTFTFSPDADDPVDKAFRECDEKLEKDFDDAKNQLKYFMQSRDDWRSRAKHAEEEIEDLKATLEKANTDRTELQNECEFYHGLYTELRKDYDKLFEDNKKRKDLYTELSKTYDELFEDNKKMKARTDCLREEVKWYRIHYKDQSDKIQDLKSRLNSMCGVTYDKYVQSRDIGYENGQINLWNMLQNVRDVKPEEFDPECETLGDILDMDLEDFLDAYKKWEEKQRTVAEEAKKQHVEYMRSYLNRYCVERLCFNCPLYDASKPITSCVFSKLTDEEVEKYYRKVIESERKKLHFPVSARLPQSWECILEAKVEINRDILNKICGIDLDD